MMEKVSLHPFIALLILCVLAVSAHASVMALASSVLHDIISNAKLRCVSPLREEDQKEGVSHNDEDGADGGHRSAHL